MSVRNFITTALKSFKTSGTIKPSSPSLVNMMLKEIDFTEDLVIIELGAGDGVVTYEIASRMTEDSQLYALEINADFYTMTKNKVREHENVQVLPDSAFEISAILKRRGIEHVDYIISSLPLSFFKDSQTKPFLEECYEILSPGRCYIQYQYSLQKYKMIRQIFDKVKLNYTFRNLPPAFVYTCYRLNKSDQ